MCPPRFYLGGKRELDSEHAYRARLGKKIPIDIVQDIAEKIKGFGMETVGR